MIRMYETDLLRNKIVARDVIETAPQYVVASVCAPTGRCHPLRIPRTLEGVQRVFDTFEEARASLIQRYEERRRRAHEEMVMALQLIAAAQHMKENDDAK